MEIDAYLKRINYANPVKQDAQTLYGLHLANMLAVPFENLDIGLKRKIHISEQAIYKKIVMNKRGGFCYELNGLFAWLLNQIGFHVTYLNARVFNEEGKLGIEFAHLALLVQIPGHTERWLADVGFGDSFLLPLNFEERGEQSPGLRAYRLEQTSNDYVVWQKNYEREWKRQYTFRLESHKFPDEYEGGCQYHQTSPDSSFTRRSIISRATENGRVSLENGRLIQTVDGQRSEQPIAGKEEYRVLLKKHFDVVL